MFLHSYKFVGPKLQRVKNKSVGTSVVGKGVLNAREKLTNRKPILQKSIHWKFITRARQSIHFVQIRSAQVQTHPHTHTLAHTHIHYLTLQSVWWSIQIDWSFVLFVIKVECEAFSVLTLERYKMKLRQSISWVERDCCF